MVVMNTNNSLGGFELHYEEMEKKKVTKAKSKIEKPEKYINKVSIKRRALGVIAIARYHFNKTVHKLKPQSKKSKKLTKVEQKTRRDQKIRGILGIGLLLVTVSVAYSTYMTNLFVDGTQMIIALVPQVIFAAIIIIIAFYKIFK